MANHFHALISVPPRMTVEQALQLIKGGFSYRAKKETGFQGEIWQRGFSDEFIVDVAAYRARCAYIRQNPVRAGLARLSEEYPYGSAGWDQKMDSMPLHLQGLKPRKKLWGPRNGTTKVVPFRKENQPMNTCPNKMRSHFQELACCGD